MTEYNISGTIKFDVDFDIKANSEIEAKAEVMEIIKDYYHLNVDGAYHDKNDVVIKLDVVEYEEEN